MMHLDHAYASEAGMPQLNPEFWGAQIFWLIVIFSFLYVVIWKVFLPKITYSIENRKSKLVNDLNEAQKLKENAEKKLLEYNNIIEIAIETSEEIINKIIGTEVNKSNVSAIVDEVIKRKGEKLI